MIHHTRQNPHFSTQLDSFARHNGITPYDLYRRAIEHVPLTRNQWERATRGIPFQNWDLLVAWLHYGSGLHVDWPIAGWLWEPFHEAIWEGRGPTSPVTPTNYLPTILKREGLYLWQFKREMKALRRGPPPKHLSRMMLGQTIPQGICAIPVIGLTLRIPIRPFLPSVWTESSKT